MRERKKRENSNKCTWVHTHSTPQCRKMSIMMKMNTRSAHSNIRICDAHLPHSNWKKNSEAHCSSLTFQVHSVVRWLINQVHLLRVNIQINCIASPYSVQWHDWLSCVSLGLCGCVDILIKCPFSLSCIAHVDFVYWFYILRINILCQLQRACAHIGDWVPLSWAIDKTRWIHAMFQSGINFCWN